VPTRVLLADDIPDLRFVLGVALRKSGYVVFEADSGDSALQLMREEAFDVAIIDVNMSGRNGLDVCRKVRSDPEFANLLIIVMSANEYEHEAMAAGADRFIAKPFLLSQLRSLIKEVLIAGSWERRSNNVSRLG
jgi:CheY-like chemotaxis protein